MQRVRTVKTFMTTDLLSRVATTDRLQEEDLSTITVLDIANTLRHLHHCESSTTMVLTHQVQVAVVALTPLKPCLRLITKTKDTTITMDQETNTQTRLHMVAVVPLLPRMVTARPALVMDLLNTHPTMEDIMETQGQDTTLAPLNAIHPIITTRDPTVDRTKY